MSANTTNTFKARLDKFWHNQDVVYDFRARLQVGDWILSEFGTSAGTRLGPLLFIIHLHDIPKCIKPRFADDLVAFSLGNDISDIQRSLQHATDQLVQWTINEGMTINAAKTKVMLFGERSHTLSIKIQNTEIENVRSYKYLVVILDPRLDFGACQFTQPMSIADTCLHTSAARGWQRYYLTLAQRLRLLFVNKLNCVKFITIICIAPTALG